MLYVNSKAKINVFFLNFSSHHRRIYCNMYYVCNPYASKAKINVFWNYFEQSDSERSCVSSCGVNKKFQKTLILAFEFPYDIPIFHYTIFPFFRELCFRLPAFCILFFSIKIIFRIHSFISPKRIFSFRIQECRVKICYFAF